MENVAKKCKLTEDQIQMIKDMSIHRHTQFDIAEKVGCATDTVRRYQQKFDLPASNRQEASGRARIAKEAIQKAKKAEEEPKKAEEVRDDGKWTSIENAEIRISGQKTGFLYSIGFACSELVVKTGYSDDIKIDMTDLAAFGNELLDIAEKMNEMKKNVLKL